MKLPILLSFLSAAVLLAQVPSAPPSSPLPPGTPAPPVPLPPSANNPAAVVDGNFEEPPVLKASEILQPQWLSGQHHKVREDVTTYAGENWYVIDSDAGVFEAAGNVMLQNRIREIYAILQLRQIVKSEVYGQALKNAAKSPFVMAKNLIEHPVDTIAAVPKGVFKLVKGAGRAVQNAADGRKKSEYENNAAAELGVGKAKRELAFQYGVNPYSSNPVLQKELNSMGWTSFAGKATIGVLTAGIGSGLGATYGVSGVMSRNAVRLRDTNPNELQMQNKASLMRMGASDAAAEQYFRNTALSPAHHTNMIAALESLQGVTGRVDFAMLASGTVENETDANFFEQTAQLMARVHAESMKLKSIEVVDGFPICVGENGARVIAIHWDYAAWTQRAADFLADLQTKDTKLAVMITGQISPLLRQQLESRKVQVFERVIPGPLK